MKGCGTEHFLVRLWQEVLEDLEDPRATSVLSFIDYSKVFNRLDWNLCLTAPKNKGASNDIILIIASFLSGCEMAVKLGDTLFTARPVLGGVPQGTLLGVLLFNLTVDNFEESSDDVISYETIGGNPVWQNNEVFLADGELDEE